ncbi:HPP family protein [Kitasatospora cinereorecta]|uniref:HPP family protein n=1 Tax=Kitasatospora cinereorecta TaxID=285560 RepID=A0ABW0V7W1_9ACTN
MSARPRPGRSVAPDVLRSSTISTDRAARPRTALHLLTGRAPAPPSAGSLLHAAGVSSAMLLLLVSAGALLHRPALIPPLAASAALIHGSPTMPLAQPRSVVGGHLVAAATGYAVLTVLGGSMWAAALAGGLALAVMMVTRTPHSPGAATAVIVVLQAPRPVPFLLTLAAATVLLVLAGTATSRARRTAPSYPAYWW